MGSRRRRSCRRPRRDGLTPLYFFFFVSPRGASGGRDAASLTCLALCASFEPEEFFFGFLSPISIHAPACLSADGSPVSKDGPQFRVLHLLARFSMRLSQRIPRIVLASTISPVSVICRASSRGTLMTRMSSLSCAKPPCSFVLNPFWKGQ